MTVFTMEKATEIHGQIAGVLDDFNYPDKLIVHVVGVYPSDDLGVSVQAECNFDMSESDEEIDISPYQNAASALMDSDEFESDKIYDAETMSAFMADIHHERANDESQIIFVVSSSDGNVEEILEHLFKSARSIWLTFVE